MASSPSAAALTEGHRLAQLRLGASTVRLMRSTWPLLDPTDLDGTVERWLRVTVPLIDRQARQSTLLAGQYVQAFRTLEVGVDPGYAPVLAPPPDRNAVTTSLTVTGPVRIREQMTRLIPLAQAARIAESAMAAAGMRHALNGGRDTIIGSTRADRLALGWVRVVSGNPCAFCLMLASRGPVYRAETAGFQAHDSCSCSAEPVYSTDSAWPPGSRRAQALWQRAKAMDGDTTLNFRHLVEGRPTVTPGG